MTGPASAVDGRWRVGGVGKHPIRKLRFAPLPALARVMRAYRNFLYTVLYVVYVAVCPAGAAACGASVL